MPNIKLNPGGLIGGLAFGVIAGAIIFSNIDINDAGPGAFKIPIFALIVGACAGNFAWGFFLKDL